MVVNVKTRTAYLQQQADASLMAFSIASRVSPVRF
jgi:hypothetical protein